jgi:two-component system response regulator PilR (NtrC family)
MNAAPRASILVVDDEAIVRDVLATLLQRRSGHLVQLAKDGAEARAKLTHSEIDLVLVDLFLPDTDGIELLRTIKAQDPTREVIMMTAHGSVETAVEAMKAGAFHYLSKPFQNDEVVLLVETALTQRRLRLENAGLRRALTDLHRYERMIGKSAAMQQLFRTIDQVAAARTTVLITGESGTGKELTAEAIHKHSQRADAPFVTVNSSNLPSNLLESHLFGHVKGAFTGATVDHTGLFESAAGGTLFFDEISTIPLEVQSKLLRVIQEKEFLPLGSVKPVRVDVRIVAATNEDLARLVQTGGFREDLYYRLNVISIHLPPLRERREDIPLLVDHFMAGFGDEHSKPGLQVSSAAMQWLVSYNWPGNVRQLRNVLERSVLLCSTEELGPELFQAEALPLSSGSHAARALPDGLSYQQAVEDYERGLIQWALDQEGGVQRRAAERLGVKPTTLNERMKRLGMRL